MSDTPALASLVEMLRRVLAEQRDAREDIHALIRMLLRQDATLAAALTEMRGLHTPHARIDAAAAAP